MDKLTKANLLKKFDYDGAFRFTDMLRDQISGKNDSWAIRWHASAYLSNKLTLYPSKSLVLNIGTDNSGTNCGKSEDFNATLSSTAVTVGNPIIQESNIAREALKNFFLSRKTSLFNSFMSKLKSNVNNIAIRLVKTWLPPCLLTFIKKIYLKKNSRIVFEGPFPSWMEASKSCTGYNIEIILQKVLSASLKVKSGDAVYERDSVLFNKIEYSWPITAGLMQAAAINRGFLSVIDFGGALGSSFYQNREFLVGLKSVRWSIVEQTHFVEAGKRNCKKIV